MTGHSHPDTGTVRSALRLACRAPSLHNTQPWRWRMGERSLHLYADRARALPVTDPQGRDLLISCGTVLHHARIAFAAADWRTRVTRFPNPGDADHLAALEFPHADGAVEELAVTLAEAAAARWTDRRPFLQGAFPAPLFERLGAVAAKERARLTVIDEPERRRELQVALTHADAVQRARADYRSELHAWVGRRQLDALEGVPARNVPAAGRMVRHLPSRSFGVAVSGELDMPLALDDGGRLCLLSTAADGPADWLRAGEALSAVLLHAAAAGLASCPLSQVTELGSTRDLARLLLADGTAPQLALRLGWPLTRDLPAPPTPRRHLDDVLEPLAQA